MSKSCPVGAVFGRLTIVSESFRPEGKSRNYVFCECSCGTYTQKACADISSGATTSCGCYAREQSSARESTHGKSGGPEYNVWKGIKQRCTNPNHTHYSSYGGRGITMCASWLNSFEAFLADMGPRPDGMTIDRIDNEKGYYKENCRWATKKQQSRNVRTNTWVEIGGIRMTAKEAAEYAVVDYPTLVWRISKGWDIDRALNTPSRNPNNRVNRRKKAGTP